MNEIGNSNFLSLDPILQWVTPLPPPGLGYNAVENPVHVNDLYATMLRLIGIDHLRLTHRFQGRDFRLNDVGG